MFASLPDHGNVRLAIRIAMIWEDHDTHTELPFAPNRARSPLLPRSDLLRSCGGIFHDHIGPKSVDAHLAPVLAGSLSGFGCYSEDYRARGVDQSTMAPGSLQRSGFVSLGRTQEQAAAAQIDQPESQIRDSSRRENRGIDGWPLPQRKAGRCLSGRGRTLENGTWLHAADQAGFLSNRVTPAKAEFRPLSAPFHHRREA
jgi:hypothetical protein